MKVGLLLSNHQQTQTTLLSPTRHRSVPLSSSIRLIQNLNPHIYSYLSEQSIIESHEIVLSDSSTTHAIKFKLGFLMVDEVVVDQFAVS